MKKYILGFLLLLSLNISAQIKWNFVDLGNEKVTKAAEFLEEYLREFKGYQTADYTKYWSASDCKKSQTPDPIVYSISSGYPTYSFGVQKSIFYARDNGDHIHLKALLTQMDSSGVPIVYAITNHFVRCTTDSNKTEFIKPIEVNKARYKRVKNGPVTYYMSAQRDFNKAKSDSLLSLCKEFEKTWGFEPIEFEYYLAETQDELGQLRGLDYFYGMEQPFPSGMSFPEDKIIFTNGYGEGHFHEVLHLYLNPLYGKKPVNHGLIYYLSGEEGVGHMAYIKKMNNYLDKYPETDFTDFEKVQTKDITLHIDHTIVVLICKMVYEKDGISGLKRLLTYNDFEYLFKQEFKIERTELNQFLKRNFRKYK